MSEIQELFVDRLTADNKYSLHNRENLPQSIPMELFKKQKPFSQFFANFLKFTSNFEHFEKKCGPPSLCIFKVTDWQKRGQRNV